jgi:hypothetical protein
MFLSGVCTPLIAALAPWFAQRHGLTDARLGLYFTVQFLASFLAAAISTRHALWSLRVGFLCLAAGIPLLVSPSIWISLLGAAVLGTGLGSAIPAINAVRAYGENAASGLISLNFLWSLGALACSVALHHPGVIAFATLGALALSCFLQANLWFFSHYEGVVPRATAQHTPNLLLECLFALCLLLYVGAENGIAGWAKVLCGGTGNVSVAGYSLVAFSAAMLVGRLISPLLVARLKCREKTFLFWCLGGTILSTSLIVVPMSAKMHVLLIGLAGLFAAPVFPLIVFLFTSRIPQERGWAFCASGVGASVLPFAMGVMSMRTSISWAYSLPAAALAIVFAIMVRLFFVSSTEPSRSGPVLARTATP